MTLGRLLQDDGNVRGVEELDGVRRVLATVAGRLDGEIHAEALEVYDDAEDENCGHEVHDVGEVLPVERLAKGPDLVLSGGEQVEERDDGALELGAAPRVDGCGREALPDDGLADVGGDEERNSGSKAVALL